MTLEEKIVLIIIILAAIPVLFIIIRKFSVLSVLSIDSIPGEKEASFKKELIKKKVDRDLFKIVNVFISLGNSIKRKGKSSLSIFEGNLRKLKSFYLKKKVFSLEKKGQIIKDLFKEVGSAEKEDDDALTEAKLLEIINLDEKNAEAFFALGHFYFEADKFNEAIQTFSHVLKLLIREKKESGRTGDISISEVYFSLAEVAKEMERTDNALEYIAEALDLEPNNPRFLDLALNLSVIKKDKKLAENYYYKMSEINPENKKLITWENEIEALGDNNEIQ